jgi:hypothetical protein
MNIGLGVANYVIILSLREPEVPSERYHMESIFMESACLCKLRVV